MNKNNEFQYDDSEEVSIYDTDIIGDGPEAVEGWPKDAQGELVGEADVEVRYTVKNEDDRFDAPYQNGWVTGGSKYRCVDELRIFLGDKDITELVTEKALDRIREKLDEDIDQEEE